MTEYWVIGLFSVVLLVLVVATWRERKAADRKFIIERCTSR